MHAGGSRQCALAESGDSLSESLANKAVQRAASGHWLYGSGRIAFALGMTPRLGCVCCVGGQRYAVLAVARDSAWRRR